MFHKIDMDFEIVASTLSRITKGLFRVKMHSLLLRPGSDTSIS